MKLIEHSDEEELDPTTTMMMIRRLRCMTATEMEKKIAVAIPPWTRRIRTDAKNDRERTRAVLAKRQRPRTNER